MHIVAKRDNIFQIPFKRNKCISKELKGIALQREKTRILIVTGH